MDISGTTVSGGADTAQQVEVSPNGHPFDSGTFSLDDGAAGPCRIGGSTVSVASQIGIEIVPGQSYTIQAAANLNNAHHTAGLWVAFTSAAATDFLSWTIHQA